MAVSFSLAEAGHNRVRYILSSESTGTDSGSINTIGGPSTLLAPDLLTDLLNGTAAGAAPPPQLPAGGNQGPLLLMTKVVAQGYGAFAAGAQTAAKARALWLSDRSGADPGALIATATCRITPRAGAPSGGWFVNASVDGSDNPIITVSTIAAGPSGVAYLDIFVRDTIGF